MSTASDIGFSGSQADEVVIAARGIGKTYGHVRALHDVSFELRRGEVVAVFGDNGAGKSTLAKCLCGVETPDVGHIEIDAHPVELHSIRDAERHGITSAHQDLALAPDLSVLENMFLGRELLGDGWRGWFRMLSRSSMAARSRDRTCRAPDQAPVSTRPGWRALGRAEAGRRRRESRDVEPHRNTDGRADGGARNTTERRRV